MRTRSLFLIAASTAALAACGSSRNNAPVVYGTQPAAAGRIYNSPAELPSAQTASYREPARLAPAAPVEREALPSAPAPAPTYVSAYETVKSPPAGGGWVTVRPGDTVYAIARRTGASPQAIIAENGLPAPYTLRIGDTLRVPDPGRKIANDLAQPAPQATPVSARRANIRIVRRGDTLYSIARASGASLEAIAQANGLRPPYTLSVGQELIIPGADGSAGRGGLQREASLDVADIARAVSYTPPPAAQDSGRLFDWPVRGAIIAKYGATGAGRRNEGVNIAAPKGTPVRAAADGEVVYRGSELDGYGNLLLIRHDDGFVTAYAHNDVMLVRKGQKVQKGQVIAKVGQTGAVSEPQLHFEIRQNLKSVDPLAFLDQ
ncbi:peptidoglycan DD-metalloendopeptidase family protein [Amphiplicatus metriothermophilus]|nr:M23 family metallopeptidase [Amphiplicatus metriothermophilus]MBB5519489.1 murein DD-endopeptidase MepM/ murein hydrolase activator NlpD [Amphiplicatus metriothermophilus]